MFVIYPYFTDTQTLDKPPSENNNTIFVYMCVLVMKALIERIITTIPKDRLIVFSTARHVFLHTMTQFGSIWTKARDKANEKERTVLIECYSVCISSSVCLEHEGLGVRILYDREQSPNLR